MVVALAILMMRSFFVFEMMQVVYVGLHIITPLISIDLLKYPKLCHEVSSISPHKNIASFTIYLWSLVSH